MKIICKLWDETISKSMKTKIVVTQVTNKVVTWVLNSISAWLVNVYTKNEIWDITRDFSVDFENIFLS